MRNLKIEELFVGAYVQKLIEAPGRFTKPMLVGSISDNEIATIDSDGVIVGGSELGQVFPIPIDERVLEGFRFVKVKGDNVWMKAFGDIRLTVGLRWSGGVQICRRCAISGRIACWNEEIRYIHELQRWWNDRVYFPYDVPMELKWRGAREKKEEL